MGERWIPVPDYVGLYEISDLGRIRRLARVSQRDRRGVAKSLSTKLMPITLNNGHKVVRLWRDGRGVKFYVDPALERIFGICAKPDEVGSLAGEEWRPVVGFSGYEISNLGRIKSATRFVRHGSRKRYIRGRLLETTIPKHGYMKTELSADGEVKTLLIHRLVAEAFVANPLGLDVVHHKDENRLNNRADNLEWTTRGGNVQDWFDRRRIVVSVETIETIIAAHRTGKLPAEILAALPRKHKGK